MTRLTITNHRRGGPLHLCVAGEIDLGTSTALDQAITIAVTTCQSTGGVLVDLADVTFVDCVGVTSLLTGRRLATARGLSYQAVNAFGIALHVLQILELGTVLSGPAPRRPIDDAPSPRSGSSASGREQAAATGVLHPPAAASAGTGRREGAACSA